MRILKIAEQLDDNVFPKIKYHRKCRQICTMKSSLQKIVNDDGGSKQELEGESSNSKVSRKSLRGRSETSASSHILPKVCIFCEKVSRYKKGKSRETLVESCELRAGKTVKAAANQKCDQRILSKTSNELHTSDRAMYHMSCYKDYTRILYKQKSEAEEADDECSPSNLALNNVKNYVIELFEKKRAIEFKDVLAKLQSEMETVGMDEILMKTAKHNLKRTLDRSIEGLCFTNDDTGKLVKFLDNLDLKTAILENQALKKEISELKSCRENIKLIANAASIIRNEILQIKDTMPWPPSEIDLTPDKSKNW